MKHKRSGKIVVCLLLCSFLLSGCKSSAWKNRSIDIQPETYYEEDVTLNNDNDVTHEEDVPSSDNDVAQEEDDTSNIDSDDFQNATRENPIIGVWLETHYEKDGELYERDNPDKIVFCADGTAFFFDGTYNNPRWLGMWLLQGDYLTIGYLGDIDRYYVKELTYDTLVITKADNMEGKSFYYQFVSLPESGTEEKSFSTSDLVGSWVEPQYGSTISLSEDGTFYTSFGQGEDAEPVYSGGNYSVLQGNRLVLESQEGLTVYLISECSSDTLSFVFERYEDNDAEGEGGFVDEKMTFIRQR